MNEDLLEKMRQAQIEYNYLMLKLNSYIQKESSVEEDEPRKCGCLDWDKKEFCDNNCHT